MSPMSLPPGFRFHPTDEELVAYYLDRKINGRTIELEIIPEVDIYKCEPWDLPDKSFLPGKDMEWYFYSPRDKKYPNGSRTNRATRAGYWKATGKDRPVYSNSKVMGMKKTLVYYRGRAPHGIRTNWVMHEYRLIDPASSSSLKDSYALCRIFKKNILLPKAKEENNERDGKDNLRIPNDDDDDDRDTHAVETNYPDHDREAEDNKKLKDVFCNPKLPSDTSSSELTQGTPARIAIDSYDSQTILSSDEANSSANIYSFGLDFSTLIQDLQLPMPTSTNQLQCQFSCPPLELEDFPRIYFADSETKISKQEDIDDYMTCNMKHRDSINGTLEEIFSLCSSGLDSFNNAK